MKDISKIIQDEITARSKPEKAKWLENYVKHDIKSKGVGMSDIRKIIKETNLRFGLDKKPVPVQIELLNDLMSQSFTEDKLSAILYLQLFWSGKNEIRKVDLISYWFDKYYIKDWNVCDWLCVKILTPMLDQFNQPVIEELKKWNKDENMWKARASLVAFAQAKKIENYKDTIREFAIELIKREERFCKTAVGWVLREYSKIDPTFVTDFLEKHKAFTSAEVRKNATKYF